MTRLAWAVLVASILSIAVLPLKPAQAAASVPPTAWMLVDVDTGLVLAAQAPHQPLPIASASKLMTALLAVDRLPSYATVTVDFVAATRPANRIGMKVGEQWPLQQALEAMLIVSANDAAYAVGTAAAGTLANFGPAATEEGQRLGLVDSTWHDPAGLDGTQGVDGGNLVSAYDLAILARAVLAQPVLASIVGQSLATFIGPDGQTHTLHQSNKLIGTYPGAIGVKTGYTTRAGEVLVAAATRGSRTLIAISIGGTDAYNPAKFLLDQGFTTPASTAGTGEYLPPPPPQPVTSTTTTTTVALPATGAVSARRAPQPSSAHDTVTWVVEVGVGAAAALAGVTWWTIRRRRLRRRASYPRWNI